MARCPFAEWRPVSLRASQRVTIAPQGLVLHTAVSDATVVTPTGETRWHFYVGRTGKLYQFFDTTVPAACQLDGNFWRVDGQGRGFISVESWDGAGTSVWPNYRTSPNSGPAWTPEQLQTLARLAAWLHDTHGIPLVPATGARGRGIGYHRQFQGPKGTGELIWTSSHACPGARRIAQWDDVIRIAKTLTGGAPEPEPVEDDVELSDQMAVPQWLIDEYPNDKGIGDGKMSVQTALASGYAHARLAKDRVTEVRAEVRQLQAQVNAMAVTLAAIHEAVGGPDTPEPPAPEPDKPLSYVVKPGDTLGGIADLFRVTVEALAEVNNLSDPNRIFPGQVLTIPE